MSYVINTGTTTKSIFVFLIHSLREGRYNFIDNIIVATKFVNKSIAQQICNECRINFNMDLVVIPILITYEIIEE